MFFLLTFEGGVSVWGQGSRAGGGEVHGCGGLGVAQAAQQTRLLKYMVILSKYVNTKPVFDARGSEPG